MVNGELLMKRIFLQQRKPFTIHKSPLIINGPWAIKKATEVFTTVAQEMGELRPRISSDSVGAYMARRWEHQGIQTVFASFL